ncbi:MAG: MXAN_6640 family putative metalloprotease [Pedobacter sp.]
MRKFIFQMALLATFVMATSMSAFAGALDEYYLTAFGVQSAAWSGSVLQKAVLLPSTEASQIPHCGTPLKHKLRQDWDNLEPATQKTLAKTVALLPTWAGTTNDSKYRLTGGRFLIHYTTTGTDKDKPPLTDANTNGIPDWVETVAQTFEDVATSYEAGGWNLAPTSNSAPYDVYLRNLADQKLYGQTTTSTSIPSTGFANAYSSYIEIDNDYLDSIYDNYTPLQNLQISASHEYHHAIQYGYNIFFDVWYAEATATWYEDEIYDNVNQIYNYLAAWFTNPNTSLDTASSLTTGGGYGRWIFNRFLAEQHGTTVVRSAWEKLATLNPANGQEIPMVPVLEGLLSAAPYSTTLGDDFFGLAKRFYTRDWSSHTSDISRIHTYIPVNTFGSYPVTASSQGTAGASPSITLPHYSYAFYRFDPSSNPPVDLNITVNGTSGIKATVFLNNGSGTLQEFPFDSVNGTTVSIHGFRSSTEVALLVANVVNVDNHMVSFSTNGSLSGVTEPPNTPASTLTPASAGGGGGCFIATAAYGSYLHPQVQALRDFRDRHLLTNPLGQTFVNLYYRFSPPVADFIAQHDTLRLMVRLMLTPLVFAVKNPGALGVALLIAAFAILLAIRRRPTILTGRS